MRMRIFGIILKLVLFILASIILLALIDVRRPSPAPSSLSDIPEYSYLPEVRELIHRNCFGEASELCADIIREKLPGAEEAKALKKLCDQEVSSAGNRISRAVNGFVTGSSKSLEEAGGAMLSDLIIYGDIRDLVIQGYFKVTGRETDPFIVVLSTAGLATSLIQSADWLPSMLKLLRKAGAVTENLAKTTVSMVSVTLKHGKAETKTIRYFSDMGIFLKQNSFPRSARLLRYVETPKDLALYTRLTMHSSTVPYLLLRSGGRSGAFVIRRFGSTRPGMELLKAASRRGPAGVAWLRNFKIVKRVKWGARVSKAIYAGHLHDFIYHTAKTFTPARWGFWIAAFMMYLYSFSIFFDLRTLFRKKTPAAPGKKR